MPGMMGYFTNSMAKLNRYIERENKNGKDIPRFTKNQIRLVVRYLERRELFRFRHTLDCPGGRSCRCDLRRREEFIRILQLMNRKIPRAALEAII